MLTAAVLILCACTADPVTTPRGAVFVGLFAAGDSVVAGDTLRLKVVVLNLDRSAVGTVTLTSTDPAVATIDPDGLIHAHTPGTFSIIGTLDGKHDSIMLRSLPRVGLVSVVLPQSIVSSGRELIFTVVLRSAAGDTITHRTVAWRSTNPSALDFTSVPFAIASAKAPGTAWVVAEVAGVKDSAIITVLPAIHSITVVEDNDTIDIGDTLSLTVVARDIAGNVLNGLPVNILFYGDTAAFRRLGPTHLISKSSGRADVRVDVDHLPGASAAFFAAAHLDTVTAGSASNWCSIETGTGRAMCYGNNAYGQLGHGSVAPYATLVPVAGPPMAALGGSIGNHVCGLTPAGAAYCWGTNAAGQLGSVIAGTCVSSVVTVACSRVPVAVPGVPAFDAIADGYDHTCALTAAGAAWCWGLDDGALGAGTLTGTTAPPRAVAGPSFASITTGQGFTCGLTSAGAPWCWGHNTRGRLGIGDTTASAAAAPVALPGGHTFVQLVAGMEHACGRTAAGDAWCWGGLNDGTHVSPTLVASGLGLTTLSAGWSKTCGLTGAGAAWCWGQNFGTAPVRAGGSKVYTHISVGWNEAFAGEAGTGTLYRFNNPAATPARVDGQR